MKKREWLVKLRGNLTHQEVANKAGIERSTYSGIEVGLRNPSVKTAKKIAEALNFDWTYFFDEKHGDSQQTA